MHKQKHKQNDLNFILIPKLIESLMGFKVNKQIKNE